MRCTRYPALWRLAVGFCSLLWLVPAIAQAQDAAKPDARPGLLERLKERRIERKNERVEQRSLGDEAAAAAVQAITAPGNYVFSLTHQGHERSYRVHVPATYVPGVPAALVMSLHGGGGNMDYQANDTYYGQISKSEQAGFVAVFPNGYSRLPGGKLATWNAGHCCGSARDEKIDDVGFIRAVVARLRTQLSIDPRRVFANGMSNGGMMAYRLACEAPDVFKAIASVAGTDNTTACTPSKPISVLHIHAKDDDMVLFNGGAGRDRTAVTNFVSVPDSVAQWVRLNGCSAAPKQVLEVSGARCDVYTPCNGGAEVKLCVTDAGGHSWPGGTKPRGGAPGSAAVSATDLIADFFASR